MMNNTLKKALVILITLVSVLCFSGAAVDSKININEQYIALFNEAISSDGARSELVADELAIEFDKNPEKFISALSLQSNETIETVADLLAYGHYFDGFEKYLADISCANNNFDKSFEKTVELLEKHALLLYGQDTSSEDIAPPESFPFYPETLQSFIDMNISLGNIDEEYFSLLGNAYRLDSKLFLNTISKYSDDEIQFIAKAVAYDCRKNGYKIEFNDADNHKSDGIIPAFYDVVKENDNIDINEFLSGSFEKQPLSSSKSAQVPVIGTMIYTSGALEVGSVETLKVTFSETTSTSSTRTYWTEVYGVRNGNAYLKASKYITIPAGTTSKDVTYSIAYSDVGPVYTLVKVYTSQGGTLLASRQGTYSDTTYGRWLILVGLPENRDYKGTLTLYRANGTALTTVSCLGRSASNYNMYTTNGHTPTGRYTGYLYGPITSNTAAYGEYKVINMTGVSGVIVDSGRSGIWIHGGRYPCSNTSATWYPLSPTNGCVRVSPSSQLSLQNYITSLSSSTGYHYSTGSIVITEVSN